MPGRPREHVLEEESFIALRDLLPAEWTLEEVRRDYGLDARIEVFEGGQATGLAFWAQLKATDEPNVRRSLKVSFETTSLNYLFVQADPVLLVRYHAPTRRLFGAWLHRQDIRLKRAGQKSATVSWRLPDELGSGSSAPLVDEVRRYRRIGSPASLPLSVHLDMPSPIESVRGSVLALLRATLAAAGAPLSMVDEASADLRLTIRPTVIKVDTPLFTLRAETEPNGLPLALADNAAAALAVALGGLGLPAAAVDLVLRCSSAQLLTSAETAGRLAQAFATAGRWRDASDLSLECLTGPPGRELLGRLLDVGVLMADRQPSAADARHVAANLIELARRQDAAGENSGAASYSAGNWLFHTVHDYPAALQAYEAAADARPDYRTQDYWLQETAAALFETGEYAAAAAMYGQAQAAVAGPAVGLLARTADCLAHAGDTEQALDLFEQYRRGESQPEAPWLLKLLALRQLKSAAENDAINVADAGVQGEREAGESAEVPWQDWLSLVHPGLGGANDLERVDRAAAGGDIAAFLTVLTAGCAFPAPDKPEPWEALLLLAWALHQEHRADWSLPGKVFDAALNTAVHRRADDLLRDLLATGGGIPADLLAEVEKRVAKASAQEKRVVIRTVREDGTRETVEIGFGKQRR